MICKHCQYESCVECNGRYFLGFEDIFPCMNCKQEFDIGYINSVFPKSFFKKEYREHKSRLLFEKEKQFMKITQQEINIEKLIEEKLELIKSIEIEIECLKIEKEYINNLSNIKICPKEDCDGYLQDNVICSRCKTMVCDKCSDIITDIETTHTCDEELLKNMRAIISECKPCPNCNVLIYKTQGCDYMWCTQCDIGFSWRTGKICKSAGGHNVHKEDFSRKISDNKNDRKNCINIFMKLALGDSSDGENELDYISNIIIPYIEDIESKEVYRGKVKNDFSEIHNIKTHMKDRKSLLSGKITEEEFMRRIYINSKTMTKNILHRKIKLSFYDLFHEQIRRIYKNEDIKTLVSICENIDNFATDANLNMNAISMIYDIKINETFLTKSK